MKIPFFLQCSGEKLIFSPIQQTSKTKMPTVCSHKSYWSAKIKPHTKRKKILKCRFCAEKFERGRNKRMGSRKRKAFFPWTSAGFLWKHGQKKSLSGHLANLSWWNLDLVRSFRQESQVEGREGEATIRLQCRQRSCGSGSVCGTTRGGLPKLQRGRRNQAGAVLVQCCSWFEVELGRWCWWWCWWKVMSVAGLMERSPFFSFFLTFWLTHFEIRNSAGTGLWLWLWEKGSYTAPWVHKCEWGCQLKFPLELVVSRVSLSLLSLSLLPSLPVCACRPWRSCWSRWIWKRAATTWVWAGWVK